MEKNRKNYRETSGQSLVEIAVALVLILFVLSGAVDLGRAFFAFLCGMRPRKALFSPQSTGQRMFLISQPA
jgi:hypothetical protein